MARKKQDGGFCRVHIAYGRWMLTGTYRLWTVDAAGYISLMDGGCCREHITYGRWILPRTYHVWTVDAAGYISLMDGGSCRVHITYKQTLYIRMGISITNSMLRFFVEME